MAELPLTCLMGGIRMTKGMIVGHNFPEHYR